MLYYTMCTLIALIVSDIDIVFIVLILVNMMMIVHITII